MKYLSNEEFLFKLSGSRLGHSGGLPCVFTYLANLVYFGKKYTSSTARNVISLLLMSEEKKTVPYSFPLWASQVWEASFLKCCHMKVKISVGKQCLCLMCCWVWGHWKELPHCGRESDKQCQLWVQWRVSFTHLLPSYILNRLDWDVIMSQLYLSNRNSLCETEGKEI